VNSPAAIVYPLHLASIGIFRALVPVKLFLQADLSIHGSAERGHGNCELLPATCTDRNSGSAAKPFRNLNCPFRHHHNSRKE
jgi:hypothetical protein